MKRKTSYCQGCVRTEVELEITEISGKPFWLCSRCMNPLPRESYNKQDRKAWGANKNTNRGTNKS